MQELKLKRVYRHFKGDYYLVEDYRTAQRNRRRIRYIQKAVRGRFALDKADSHVFGRGRS